MSHHQNIVRIQAVRHALGTLHESVVFVGGATVSLYTDRIAEELRPTEDVDILIELASYKDYAGVEEQLRARGFVNDPSAGFVGRYKIQGIIVDVMPTEERILGFTNRWYHTGIRRTIAYELPDGNHIRLFDPAYFLASKIEAFKNRGGSDGRLSTDFEDIIYLLNNRTAIWEELVKAEELVKNYLLDELRALLDQPHLEEWISAHLEYTDQRRAIFILDALRDFSTSNI